VVEAKEAVVSLAAMCKSKPDATWAFSMLARSASAAAMSTFLSRGASGR
jgi:hypothetical protein